MSERPELQDVAEVSLRLLDAFADAGLKAALGGGLALDLWVLPRVTKDVDLNVFVEEERRGEVLQVLEGLGCLPSRRDSPWDEQTRGEFLRRASD